MLVAGLLALVLSQAPDAAAWTMELGGVPSAVVRARREPDRFTWSVEHLFGRRARREVTVPLSAEGRDEKGRVPEGLWLGWQPAAGCVAGFDELSGRDVALCAELPDAGTGVRMSVNGKRFKARYAGDHVLERLELADSVYIRGESWAGKNPWVEGVAVRGTGKTVALHPAEPGAQALVRAPTPTGDAAVKKDCLTLALDAEKQSRGAKRAVLGLVVEAGRAFPHAWLLDPATGAHEDPSVPRGEATERLYLQVDRGAAGRLYLALLAGTSWLERK